MDEERNQHCPAPGCHRAGRRGGGRPDLVWSGATKRPHFFIAPDGDRRMVSEVPDDLTALRQQQVRARRLGRIAQGPTAGPAGRPAGPLTSPRTLEKAPVLAAGAVTRRVDADGRLKVGTPDASLAGLLGWSPGAVEPTAVGGWLLLTQPAALVGASTPRFGTNARFSRDTKGTERLWLKPAQLEALSPGPDRYLLLVPFPERHALALVNPAVCLVTAPAAIQDLLDGHTAA